MRDRKTAGRIRTLFNRLASKLKILSPKSLSDKPNGSHQIKLVFESPHSIAYQLIGEKTELVLPVFRDMDSNLQRSNLKVSFKAYVSLTVFASTLISLSFFAAIPCILFFAFYIDVVPAILFGLGGSLFAGAFSTIGFYFYPIYRADSLKRALEDELPFITGYMSILTGAGVPPEKIFYSLSDLSIPLAVSTEARDIVRNVNLFGTDIISALQEASRRTPSDKFREMLEGFISTLHSGSNLTAYLHEKSKQYMRIKKISLKKFADTLSILAEFYVAVLLTGPLMLVIMLSVMAMLGGGNLGFLSPDLLLNILTYVGIPLGAILFLIILDATSPKW